MPFDPSLPDGQVQITIQNRMSAFIKSGRSGTVKAAEMRGSFRPKAVGREPNPEALITSGKGMNGPPRPDHADWEL